MRSKTLKAIPTRREMSCSRVVHRKYVPAVDVVLVVFSKLSSCRIQTRYKGKMVKVTVEVKVVWSRSGHRQRLPSWALERLSNSSKGHDLGRPWYICADTSHTSTYRIDNDWKTPTILNINLKHSLNLRMTKQSVYPGRTATESYNPIAQVMYGPGCQ